jgi:hypothetical protein
LTLFVIEAKGDGEADAKMAGLTVALHSNGSSSICGLAPALGRNKAFYGPLF